MKQLTEFEQQLAITKNLTQASQLLEQELIRFGIKSLAFTCYTRHPSAINRVKYDYASQPLLAWHTYYLAQGYSDFDTTVLLSIDSITPVKWDVQQQLRQAKSQTERQIRLDSIEFGIAQGISMPLFGPNDNFAIMTLHQKCNETWLHDYSYSKYEIRIIVQLYFNCVLKNLHKQTAIPQNKINKQLTERETQCLSLTAQGFTASEIAKKLFISKRTVDFHLSNANKKVGAKNKYHAINKAIIQGEILV